MVDTAGAGQSEEDHEGGLAAGGLVLAEDPAVAELALDFAAPVADVEEPELGA